MQVKSSDNIFDRKHWNLTTNERRSESLYCICTFLYLLSCGYVSLSYRGFQLKFRILSFFLITSHFFIWVYLGTSSLWFSKDLIETRHFIKTVIINWPIDFLIYYEKIPFSINYFRHISDYYRTSYFIFIAEQFYNKTKVFNIGLHFH